MTTISNRRRIIDRGTLNGRLDDMLDHADSGPSGLRADVLDLLKSALAVGRDEVRQRFEAGGSGAETLLAQAFLIDQLIRVIYDFAAECVYPAANPTLADRLSVVAVGGYGRRELAPFSDIDLLFLLPYKETPRHEQIIEYVLYMLWDLGLKVGHATRSIDECVRLSKRDLTIRTSILEARHLWGEQGLFNEMKQQFDSEVVAGTGPEFVDAKLAERDQRHRRMGDSRYVLEPNIKEGKGGLRDLQTLFWIAKYLYQASDVGDLVKQGVLTVSEAGRFAKSQEFMWNVRCCLHYLTGRCEDRLTFDVQTVMGEQLGYRDHVGTSGVERFMKHYYLTAKAVGDLTRIFCAAFEIEHQRRPRFALPRLKLFKRAPDGLAIEGSWVTLAHGTQFTDDPVNILRLFHTAQDRGLDVHPQALRAITRSLRLIDAIREDPEANRLFMEMLTSIHGPEITLRRLNEAGVFGRFVPDFGRVVAQMQHDMYHVYTVDEHTIFAIGILHGIEQGKYLEEMPVASDVVHQVQSRRALYVAVLLHDIAKGRGGDHSELGAEVALHLGPRIGLTEEEIETVTWLVRHHLMMSNTAFKRDINDPKTVSDFVDVVQSLERLRLLLVLTVADIRAVGPNVWNAWKAALLRELYYAAEETMSGGLAAEGQDARVAHARGELADQLTDFTKAEITTHLESGYPPYWLAFDTETHVRHARLMREANRRSVPISIENRVDHFRAVTEVTIYAGDNPGLFSRIARAIALIGADIVDAKIFTTADGMAIDTFWIQDPTGGVFDDIDRLGQMSTRIEQSLAGSLRPTQEPAQKKESLSNSRTRVFAVPPRVFLDNEASRTHTVVEISGRDRPGLLHELTGTLTVLNLQIASAHVTTYGETAVDVFYVKDVFGLKVTHESKIIQIREALMAALSEMVEPTRVSAAE